MKKLSIALFAISLAAAISASASVTISGSDFSNSALAGAYNGTYVATPSGHMNLAYTDPADDAVVGAKGPFGTLSNLSMSFAYSNLTGGNGNLPYAAFGLSLNGLWNGSAQEFLVISSSADQQLNGSTPIHVYDLTAAGNYAPVVWGSTMSSILGDTFSGVAFGDMQVLRAYAYIGDWPGVGNVSADINSITVTSVPEPTTITLIVGALLLLPFTLRLRKTRTA